MKPADPIGRLAFAPKIPCLVGKTDADKRATKAFRAVIKRRRKLTISPELFGTRGSTTRNIKQLFVNLDRNTLPLLGIVDRSALYAIPMLFQEQHLRGELSPLREIGPLFDLGCFSALVLDDEDFIAHDFNQIDFRRDPKALG